MLQEIPKTTAAGGPERKKVKPVVLTFRFLFLLLASLFLLLLLANLALVADFRKESKFCATFLRIWSSFCARVSLTAAELRCSSKSSLR